MHDSQVAPWSPGGSAIEAQPRGEASPAGDRSHVRDGCALMSAACDLGVIRAAFVVPALDPGERRAARAARHRQLVDPMPGGHGDGDCAPWERRRLKPRRRDLLRGSRARDVAAPGRPRDDACSAPSHAASIDTGTWPLDEIRCCAPKLVGLGRLRRPRRPARWRRRPSIWPLASVSRRPCVSAGDEAADEVRGRPGAPPAAPPGPPGRRAAVLAGCRWRRRAAPAARPS